MQRRYNVISADGHLETPPEAWVNHVPAEHRSRAPRLVHLSGGRGDAWVVEGQPLMHVGQNVKGSGPVRFAYGSYYNPDGSPREGTGGPQQRLREQDTDGLDAEVLYPPVFATRFIEGVADRDAYFSLVQAYNTFLAEDFCSLAPDRLIGNAFMPVSGIDDAVAELERAHNLGLKTVCLQQFPNGSGGPSPDDDRFWERALELGMAVAPHMSFGDFTSPPWKGPDSSSQNAAGGMTQHCGPSTPAYCLAQLIISGTFDRFPELRIYFAEVNCALLPGMLYYMDRDYHEYNDWFQLELKRLPSEYVLEHCLFGMVQEKVAMKMAAAGLFPFDRLMWGSDFPHSVGTYPHSGDYLSEAFGEIDPAVQHAILVDTPAQFFHLDPAAPVTATPVG